jgi:hypothetical protein
MVGGNTELIGSSRNDGNASRQRVVEGGAVVRIAAGAEANAIARSTANRRGSRREHIDLGWLIGATVAWM